MRGIQERRRRILTTPRQGKLAKEGTNYLKEARKKACTFQKKKRTNSFIMKRGTPG